MMSHARRILPIGVIAILGSGVAFCAPHSKDPKDCHNPVCLDKMDFFNAAKQQYEQDKSKSKKNDSTTSTTSSSSVPAPALVAAKPVETDLEERDCPMDKAELGRNTWNLLHTMAAFYPDAPAPSHQKHAVNFIKSLSVLYPCSFCAMGLREDIREYPPRVESREAFSLWMCEQHNRVNEKLNKECFPCTMEALDRRWRKGVPGCWNYVEEEDEDAATVDEVNGDKPVPSN